MLPRLLRVLSIATLLCGLLALPASAQTDPCAAAQPPFVITTGAPFTVSWLVAPTTNKSATDTTQVPNVVAGFYVQIDALPRTRTLLAQAGQPCVTGPNVGWIPYTLRNSSGVSRGSHTFKVAAFNFAVDPVTGAPTLTEQESAAVAIPFDAADPAITQPPPAPVSNLIIRR
jgi:hypothetical protein